MKMNKKALLTPVLAGLACLPVAYAHADHSWEALMGVGYTHYASDRELEVEDDVNYGLGIGYVINPTWSIEAWVTESETEVDGASVLEGTEMDVKEYRLDALYHFAENNGWTPYLVAGVGDHSFEVDGQDKFDETRVNLGVGVKKALSEYWSFRGDVRGYNSLDEEKTEAGVNLAIAYMFGGHGAPVAAAAAVVAAPMDSDGDGVNDADDACPDTADFLAVDAEGCPQTAEKEVAVELEVLFDNNSSVVKSDYTGDIERVASFMKEYGDSAVEIQGHTDSRGADEYNQSLSQSRADAVAAVLVENGVSSDRVTSKGYGESQPRANNDTAEGQAQNRRVIADIAQKISVQVKR